MDTERHTVYMYTYMYIYENDSRRKTIATVIFVALKVQYIMQAHNYK